ncbi:GNAT family N-acetyltransferase [Streptomyces sp. TG1A-8]|uniref:GNAT family N-acetyltransferase n=1 Tax=Streptomyces sp. TG1A-8 TaxID=3051385 RepID=UPI00265BC53D|nr:GNAT family N-acetyltransferase [Streptomyces sp. TG1A-8]MDO0924963.1 GNAT family N-acetyltransferase [Streptomyces sp. TG1A-8]
MRAEFTLTGCTPADHAEICALEENLWAGGPEGNQAYLEWKYHANPHLDDRYTVIARTPPAEGGELIGVVGVFGSPWERDGQRFTLPCLTDTIVTAEYRNSPLFHEMVDEVLSRLRRDGVPWLLDFGDQGTVPAMLIRGWRQVGVWGQSVVTRPPGTGHRGPWDELPVTRGPRSGLPVTAACRPDLWAMTEVVREVPADGRVRVARDSTYFGWRASNPLAKYYYLVARSQEGGAEGYLVAHRSGVDSDEGPTPTTVVECEARTEEVYADLVQIAHESLPGTRVLMWTRDLAEAGAKVLADLGAEFVEPTGRPTRDRPLPSLLIRGTGAEPVAAGLSDLDRLDVWDFRGVSGRGWR